MTDEQLAACKASAFEYWNARGEDREAMWSIYGPSLVDMFSAGLAFRQGEVEIQGYVWVDAETSADRIGFDAPESGFVPGTVFPVGSPPQSAPEPQGDATLERVLHNTLMASAKIVHPGKLVEPVIPSGGADDLLGCPFCGASGQMLRITGDHGSNYVFCEDCGATGPDGKTAGDAQYLWNDRQHFQAQAAQSSCTGYPACDGDLPGEPHDKDCPAQAAQSAPIADRAVEGWKPSVEGCMSLADAMSIVESYGPLGSDLNEEYQIKILLRDEVVRLNKLYLMAVQGRRDFRAAYAEARTAGAAEAIIEARDKIYPEMSAKDIWEMLSSEAEARRAAAPTPPAAPAQSEGGK